MENLFKYCLRLGDNSLILSHRLAGYSSKGPYLEEDLAISNIALDYIGQAEFFLQYAAEVEGKGQTSDDLAYRRPENQYYNCQLVEQPNADFAFIMARQFFIDAFNFYFYSALKNSDDPTLSAIAEKALKEVSYHIKRSSEWVVRLGDGTEESHRRMQNAVDDMWMYAGELFEMDEVDHELMQKNIAPDLSKIKQQWDARVNEVLDLATLKRPENNYMATGSKQGIHTEHLGHILSEMQYLQRAYPDAVW